MGLNGVVRLINHSHMEKLINYLFDKFIYLFRNNCFRLSVEDIYDCCRNYMRTRQIGTSHMNIVIEYDGLIKLLNM